MWSAEVTSDLHVLCSARINKAVKELSIPENLKLMFLFLFISLFVCFLS